MTPRKTPGEEWRKGQAGARVVPHDLDAEEAAIGTMLSDRHSVTAVLAVGLSSADFYKPTHATIALAIMQLVERGVRADEITVGAQLGDQLDAVGGRAELLRLRGEAPASGNAVHYGRIVHELALLRRAISVGEDLAAAAYGRDLALVREVADDAPRRLQGPIADVADAISLEDLLLDPPIDESKPWVIPGLLRLRERLVLTGAEGWGKSTLIRQICVCVASGLHPLTRVAAGVDGPKKVLLIDLQEERADLVEAMKPLRKRAGEAYASGALQLVPRPQGMNLLAPSDFRWLEGLIAKHQPQLVFIGPVRKMFRATEQYSSKMSEEAVDELTRRLDDLRVGYDFSLILEGHAGVDRNESNFRLRGSSVWMDWPEYGLGMKPVQSKPSRIVEIVDWRGRRHTGRPWPSRLLEGRGWPWRVDDDDLGELYDYLDLGYLTTPPQGVLT